MKKKLLVLGSISVALIIVFLALNYLSIKKPIAFRIPTEAMQPTIMKGEKVGIDRFAYGSEDPRRNDVVVFKDQQGRFQIKRIVGLPGEVIEIRAGKIIANGQEIQSEFHYDNAGELGKEGQKIEIPSHSYYLLGDNSSKSRDSRYFGFIQRSDIQGKAILIKSQDGKMKFLK